jgi:hypothetical protein
MEHDIIIGGLMALGSVIAALAIVYRVARAVRDAPQLAPAAATPSGTASALRPTQGW